MVICPTCTTPLSAPQYRCGQCGFHPVVRNGFLAWAPRFADSPDGFHREDFATLAAIEARHFWFRARSELLLWALGSCTAMTLLMYARNKGWDLAEVSVHLTHDRVHAEDSADAEGGTGKVEVIQRDISLRGRLSGEQRQRVLEIAARCPVHKTLTSSPQVIDSMIAGS